MRIAIDAMGGDFAPHQNIGGLAAAMTDFPNVTQFLLVGDPAAIEAELVTHKIKRNDPRIDIVPASQVVDMDDPSSAAVRSKKDSSISVAARLLKEERADAIVSAGHTGASVAAMVVYNRMLPGIDRPGIASVFPRPGGFFVLLDIGAHVDCKPIHLAQYGILGEAYSRMVLGVTTPKVGLLSIGGEAGKGNELTRESYATLSEMPLDFVGNVEGRDLFLGDVDVVVCDGFVGNVVLKSCEGLAKAMTGMVRESMRKSAVRRAGALLSKNAFRELKELTDHEQYGGAPLLGINGVCIIAHGSSSPRSIRNAVRVSVEMVQNGFNEYVKKTVGDIQWAETIDDEVR